MYVKKILKKNTEQCICNGPSAWLGIRNSLYEMTLLKLVKYFIFLRHRVDH